jgi:hypothetical protein
VAFDLGEDFGEAKTAVGRSGRPKKLRGGRPPEGRPPGHYESQLNFQSVNPAQKVVDFAE